MKSEFALSVYLILIMAHRHAELHTSSALADRLGVNPVRVRQALARLKRAGLIRAKEGAGGGFSIACDPASTSLADLFALTEPDTLKPKGQQYPTHCAIGSRFQDTINGIFAGADAGLRDYLAGFSLARVLKEITAAPKD